MFTILVISNDKKLLPILRPFESLVAGRFIISEDFDTGLKEVFEKRPSLVFIQEDVAGVSGETVGKHIKSLLQSSSPGLVLVATGARPRRDDGVFDALLNLSMPENEAREVVKAELEKLGPQVWRDHAVPVPVDTAPPLATELVQTAKDELHQLLNVPPMPAAESALPPLVVSVPAEPEETAEVHAPPPTAPGSWEVGVAEKEAEPPARVAAAEEPETEWLRQLRSRRVDPVPLAPHAGSGASRGRQIAMAATAIAIVIAGASILYVTAFTDVLRDFMPQPEPEKAVAAAAQKAPAIPSFVPVKGQDPSYRIANPGWDRYVQDNREYLLFTENKALRVVQIIALKNDAIAPPFVDSAVKEFAGAQPTFTDRSEKDGYLLEKGKAGAAEIIVYRKKATGNIRAVVLSRN